MGLLGCSKWFSTSCCAGGRMFKVIFNMLLCSCDGILRHLVRCYEVARMF